MEILQKVKFSLLSIAVCLSTFLSNSSATKGIECHDCTGLDECSVLLQNQWTGKCRTQTGGKCFIRRDPNGIIYRGCADPVSWPQLDINYNGCRYQSYGSWGKTSVVWCLCDLDLCNVNISYVINKFPGANDARLLTEINKGQGQGQGQGQVGIRSKGPGGVWSILERQKLESSGGMRGSGGPGMENHKSSNGGGGGGGGIQWGNGVQGIGRLGGKSGYDQGHGKGSSSNGNGGDSSGWYWV